MRTWVWLVRVTLSKNELAAFRALTGLAYDMLDPACAETGSQPASAEKAS